MGKRKYIYLALGVWFLLWYALVNYRNAHYQYVSPVEIGRITLVVYGDTIPPFAADYAAQLLKTVYRAEVRQERREDDEIIGAIHLDRGQYDADGIAAVLKKKFPQDTDYALALVHHDIFGEDANYLLGMAAAIPSDRGVFTISRYSVGLGSMLQERVIRKKIMRSLIVHEMGHMLGLEHCEQSGCAMNFGNSILSEIRKGDRYCAVCESRLTTRHPKQRT